MFALSPLKLELKDIAEKYGINLAFYLSIYFSCLLRTIAIINDWHNEVNSLPLFFYSFPWIEIALKNYWLLERTTIYNWKIIYSLQCKEWIRSSSSYDTFKTWSYSQESQLEENVTLKFFIPISVAFHVSVSERKIKIHQHIPKRSVFDLENS